MPVAKGYNKMNPLFAKTNGLQKSPTYLSRIGYQCNGLLILHPFALSRRSRETKRECTYDSDRYQPRVHRQTEARPERHSQVGCAHMDQMTATRIRYATLLREIQTRLCKICTFVIPIFAKRRFVQNRMHWIRWTKTFFFHSFSWVCDYNSGIIRISPLC